MDPGAALRLEGPGRFPRGSVTERSVSFAQRPPNRKRPSKAS